MYVPIVHNEREARSPAEYPNQFAMFASPTNVACTKYTPTHNPISQYTADG